MSEWFSLQNILMIVALILSVVFGLVSLKYRILIVKLRDIVKKYRDSISEQSEGGKSLTAKEKQEIMKLIVLFFQELGMLLLKKKSKS